MKDGIQFGALAILFFAVLAAVPIAGLVIGAGIGFWFLWNAWKEYKDAQRKISRRH